MTNSKASSWRKRARKGFLTPGNNADLGTLPRRKDSLTHRQKQPPTSNSRNDPTITHWNEYRPPIEPLRMVQKACEGSVVPVRHSDDNQSEANGDGDSKMGLVDTQVWIYKQGVYWSHQTGYKLRRSDEGRVSKEHNPQPEYLLTIWTLQLVRGTSTGYKINHTFLMKRFIS